MIYAPVISDITAPVFAEEPQSESPSETGAATDDAPEPQYRYSDTNVSVGFTNSPCEFGIEQGMTDLLVKYFTMYYSALGSYKTTDMSELFYFDTEYYRELTETMLDYQIRIHRDMDIDLTYGDCTVGLIFRSLEKTPDGYVISLYENNYMNYAFAGDITSYTSGIEHDFTINYAAGEYLISAHSEITGVYNLLTSRFEEELKEQRLTFSALTPSQLSMLFDELNDKLLREADEGFEILEEQKRNFNNDPDSFALIPTADNPYNAQAALDYSYSWAGKYEMLRNPQYYAYDDYGGNCNNFTSQCLFAAGIPMDTSGTLYHQWKWYGGEVGSGRSMSWTGVEYFWQYCTENEGAGIVADCRTDNVYCGRPGDIIQYVCDGTGVHSVIISKIIRDEDGNVMEYLINSNTTDKVDCPMSVYGYTRFRLIRIAGWNA